MNSLEIKDAHKVVRAIQYLIEIYGYSSDELETFLTKYDMNGISSEVMEGYKQLPKGRFLLVDVIIYYLEDELYTSRYIVKLNDSSHRIDDKYTWLTVYGVEHDMGTVSGMCEGKVKGYTTALADKDIIRYRDITKKDGALFVNWFWLSSSLKRYLF